MKPKLLYVGMTYDYGNKSRGFSFEHRNFGHSLKSYSERRNWDFIHYDFMERRAEIGLDLMAQELYELAKKEKPTYLFAVLFDFHSDPGYDVFRQISSSDTVTIHWFCDDHWRFEKYSAVVAPNFDFVCTTANSATPKYKEIGMSGKVIKTQWACNHELYVPYDIQKDLDISFVGQPHGNRTGILPKLIGRGLSVEVFGYGWKDRPRLPFHQMVRLFSRTKVNLNLSNSSTLIGQQIKGRNFEIPGTLSFQLTDNAENLTEYFEEGKEIVIFNSVEELIEKANYYLKNEKERMRIAENGYRRTLAEHTWFHRYDKIFNYTGNGKSHLLNTRAHENALVLKKPFKSLVSVIIPCYNHAHFLPEAVESVIKQTLQDFEIIIVNDGSSDDTEQVANALIQKYPEKCIHIINQKNNGLSAARNEGIKTSRGKYILPLDADDMIHPFMLEKTVHLLEMDSKVSIAYTDQLYFGTENKILQVLEYDFNTLLRQNYFGYCSLYRREAWESAGGYNPNMIWGYEDWDFWISCGEKGHYGKRISEPLFMYRIKESSMYTKALDHHDELVDQIILNHPGLYSSKDIMTRREILRSAGVTECLPFCVHFVMIDKCNAKCIMCGGDYFKSKSGKMITLEKFKIMAGNLRLENIREIVLAGAGDPLLNKDLIPIIQFVRKEYPHIRISITTNGIALTERLSKSLLEHGVDSVNISINSATKKTYERTMQVDGFDLVCKNTTNIIDLRNQMGNRIQVQFSIAINRLNIEELPALVELGRNVGIDSINVMYCRFYPENIRDLNLDNPENRLHNEDSLFFYSELSDGMVEQSKLLAQEYGIRLSHEPLFKEKAEARICTWPETQLMVGFDGEVYPCGGGELHFKDKVKNGVYNFGNALTQHIEDFWNNETYRALRLSSTREEICQIIECKNCANPMRHDDIKSHIMDWDGFYIHKSDVEELTTPLVSVIVPTFNRPDLLTHTLNSILAQTYKNFEIIVVNDAGTDVEAVVSQLNRRNNIRYIRHDKNKGLAAARNTGIKVARGKYIAYLDDDDVFYPHHLETLVHFLETSGYKIAYTDAYQAHQEKKDGKYVTKKRDVPFSFDFDYDRLLIRNFISVLCFMHEKSCLDEVGFFDESLTTHEDWDLWIRMSRRFEIAHIKKITAEFTWRRDSSSMTSEKRSDMLSTLKIIYERYRKYSKDKPRILQLQDEMADSLRAELGLHYTITPICITKRPKTITSRISMIIPVRNGGEQLRGLFKKIRSQKKVQDIEIIAIDSGSFDNSVQIAKDFGSKVISIPQHEFNHGNTRNLGVKESTGDFLVFTVQDAIPVSDYWLYSMIGPFIEHPDLAALSSRQFVRPEADLFSLWRSEAIIKSFGLEGDTIYSLSLESKHVNWMLFDIVTKRRLTFFDNVSSCIRKSVFEEIQFKPINFGEDADFGVRVMEKRSALGYLTSTGVYHWHDRGADYLLKRWYTGVKAGVDLIEDSSFTLNDISWEQILSIIMGLYRLINHSISDVKFTQDPKLVVKSFIESFRGNMELGEKIEVSLNKGNEDLDKLLKDIFGESDSRKLFFCNFKENFLISEFIKCFGEFSEFLCTRKQSLEGREHDLISCIYKIFAMQAARALATYYCEKRLLNRLDTHLERIDSLLVEGI